MFFAERYAGHTFPPNFSGLPEYADLQLNKAQTLGLEWPELQDARTIQLMKAATRAYEQTRGTTAAIIAEGQGGPEAIITWYCYAIWPRTALYGRRSPSQKLQEISLKYKSGYSFKVDADEVILEDRLGGGLFEDLQILERDLPQIIAAIRTWGESIEDAENETQASAQS